MTIHDLHDFIPVNLVLSCFSCIRD